MEFSVPLNPDKVRKLNSSAIWKMIFREIHPYLMTSEELTPEMQTGLCSLWSNAKSSETKSLDRCCGHFLDVTNGTKVTINDFAVICGGLAVKTPHGPLTLPHTHACIVEYESDNTQNTFRIEGFVCRERLRCHAISIMPSQTEHKPKCTSKPRFETLKINNTNMHLKFDSCEDTTNLSTKAFTCRKLHQNLCRNLRVGSEVNHVPCSFFVATVLRSQLSPQMFLYSVFI